MAMIVHKFGNFVYNRFLVRMCDLIDIFQAKLYNILGYIEVVKTYMNYVLFFIKETCSNQIEKLIVIFGRLSASVLKVSAPDCSLRLNYIPYQV